MKRHYYVTPTSYLEMLATLTKLLDQKRSDIAHETRRYVFLVHVGGTRRATSRTDNTMNVQARITLTVACIRTCIVLCLFDVEIQRTSMINTNLFSM